MEQNFYDSEKLAKGQQVITACAFIHYNFDGVEKLFIPKRAETKKFLPGVYELPGGHMNFGEEPKDGLKREILEEFNMNISVGDPFYVFTYTNEIKGSHSAEVDYFAKFIDPIENIKIDPKEHSEFVWIAEDEINKIISEKKGEDDPEIKAIKRGFQILSGSKINTL